MDLNFEDRVFGGPNPFPKGDGRHDIWTIAVRLAAEEDAGLRARFHEAPLEPVRCLDFFAEWFDIRAKALMFTVVWSYESAKGYEEYLKRASAGVVSWARQSCPGHFGTGFHTTLNMRIQQRTAHWMQEALKLAREAAAKRSVRSAQDPLAPTFDANAAGTAELRAQAPPLPATWQDVTIEFISDMRVQITVKNRTYAQNYAEMGFENRKTETPTKSWEALRMLAEKDGSISISIKERQKTEKRMQEIRKALRSHFAKMRIDIAADSDPLPYDSNSHRYAARFQIRTRRSYHE